MKYLILLACLILVVYATRKTEFESFKKRFKKNYKTKTEETKRFAIFSQNMDKIEAMNAKIKDFKLAINEFGDLSEAEFKKSFLGFKSIDNGTLTRRKRQTEYVGKSWLDWRTLNRVSAVQNQKSCGSCWAFSAAGAIEGAWALKTGILADVSDQNILDCDTAGSCDGGHMIYAYKTIISKGGINRETTYPYLAYDQNRCRYSSSKSVAKIINYVRIPSGDEGALEKAVTEKGPVAVAVCANSNWSYFKTGVITAPYCNCSLNHGVLIVGYNNTAIPKYWIVKNSWGTTWGNAGYIHVEKGTNACGIAKDCSYPIA